MWLIFLQLCQIPGKLIATSLVAVYPTIGLNIIARHKKIAIKKATILINFLQV